MSPEAELPEAEQGRAEALEPQEEKAPAAAQLPKDELLSPWPQFGPRSLIALGGFALVYCWALHGSNVKPAELAEGIPNIVDFVARLFPPEFDMDSAEPFGPGIAVPYPSILADIVETVQMAIIGTSIGVLLSIPFSLLAARNTSPHPSVYYTMRMVLNANRAIPEIVYALVFVAAVGLGPFGGVLALGVGTVGSMGKLYAESIESIDPQQVLAVRATGAGRVQAFIYSVLPQALPVMASYSLLYFEHNVRAATILGIVGAGGVGFTINKYLALFQYRKLMGAVILIVITVTLLDRVSDRLRKRLI